jgi:hypothetical protein
MDEDDSGSSYLNSPNDRDSTSGKAESPKVSARRESKKPKKAAAKSKSPRKVQKKGSPRKASPSERSKSPRSRGIRKDPSGLEIITDEDEVLSNLPIYRSESEDEVLPVPKTGSLARSKYSQRPTSPRATRVKLPPPPGTKKTSKIKTAAKKVDTFLTEDVGRPIANSFTESKNKIKSKGIDKFLTEDVGKPIANSFTELGNKIKSKEVGVIASHESLGEMIDGTLSVAKETVIALKVPTVVKGSKTPEENRALENLRSFIKNNQSRTENRDERIEKNIGNKDKNINENKEISRNKEILRNKEERENEIEESPRDTEDIESPRYRSQENTRIRDQNLNEIDESPRTRGQRTSIQKREKTRKLPAKTLVTSEELDNKIKDALYPSFVQRAPDSDNLLELGWSNGWAVKAVDNIYTRLGEMPDEVVREEGGYAVWKNIKGLNEIRVSDKLNIHLYPVPHLDLITGRYNKPLNISEEFESDLSDEIKVNNKITTISTSSWPRLVGILSTLVTLSQKPVSIFKASRIMEGRIEQANVSDDILSILENYIQNN